VVQFFAVDQKRNCEVYSDPIRLLMKVPTGDDEKAANFLRKYKNAMSFSWIW
jgi:hypothetical protein